MEIVMIKWYQWTWLQLLDGGLMSKIYAKEMLLFQRTGKPLWQAVQLCLKH